MNHNTTNCPDIANQLEFESTQLNRFFKRPTQGKVQSNSTTSKKLVPSNSTQSSEVLANQGKVVIQSGSDLRGSKRLRMEELTADSGVVMPPIQVRDTQEAHGYNPSTNEQ
ncbi:hypothetical protein MKW92_039725, partial [Papaver armeniacum]